MKRIFLYLLKVATIVACSGGEDGGTTPQDPTPEKPKAEIKLETASFDFPAEGGKDEISFSTTEAWTAEVINSRADGWCAINPTSGEAGDAKITVTTEANDTPDDRSASIVIKAGTASKTVKVSQKQKEALTITASKFEVEAEGGEIKIEVKANIDFDYTIEESAEDWVKYKGTRALKTSTLTFSVAENDDTMKREAKIYITSGEFNEEITIYQAGSMPSLVISKSAYVVSSEGGTIAVEVKSNVDVAVELPTDVDWLHENTSRGVSTSTYYFDIAPSEELDQRTAEIVFFNKENGLSEVVTITQTQKDALVVAKESYTVESDGGQIQIEVGHNVDFKISISAEWITRAENTRAFQTENLIFNIAPNEAKQERTGTIILTSADRKIKQTITILQDRYKSFDPTIGGWGDGGENGGSAE